MCLSDTETRNRPFAQRLSAKSCWKEGHVVLAYCPACGEMRFHKVRRIGNTNPPGQISERTDDYHAVRKIPVSVEVQCLGINKHKQIEPECWNERELRLSKKDYKALLKFSI